MAEGTVYLDVDDEITSAAARIRSSESTKVGLVVPYGSRISTSRMNFRLLSREAIVNNRRLSIIAGDPATRALAASAGLPVFATVGEYETALAGPPAAVADDDLPIADAAPAITPTQATGELPSEKPAAKRRRRDAASDDTQALLFPAAAAGTAATAAATAAAASTPTATATAPTVPGGSFPSGGRAGSETGSSRLPVRGGVGGFRVTTPVLIGATAVFLAFAVVAVGAFLILPAADITVTPRPDQIGPIPLTVTANPDVAAVDTANAVVPAVRLDVPVDIVDTFTTTGKRVETTAATGAVTFRNVDFTATNTIPAGSVVSTPNGVKFGTDRSITVPKATLVGLQVVPAFASVNVTAVKKGTAGNVEPNTITVIPPNEDPVTLTVRNQQATSGGARNEFPKVSQDDVDKAIASLQTKLNDSFTAAVAAGAGAPQGTTVFPETAALGNATPSPDPATLVGQEVPTFDLGLTATGTVIAVDASPVRQIAQARLTANIGAGYRLVDGSDKIDQGKPVVTAGVVSFPVSVTADRVRIVDADALRALVKGQTVEAARAALQPYGDVTIDTWPAWVTSITGFDSRLTVTVGGQAGSGSGPGSSGGPSDSQPAPSAGARSSAAPASAGPAPSSGTP